MDDSPAALSQAPPARKIAFAPWMAACLAAAALGSVLVGARPAFHWMKSLRARHFAAESEAYTAAGKWADALSKGQAACQLKPDEPEAQRAMALFYEKVQPRLAIPFLRVLASSPAARPSDISQYAEACLGQGNLQEASSQAALLLRMQPGNADAMRLAARIRAAGGDFDGAILLAKQAEQVEPGNLDGQFLRARIEISSHDLVRQKSGWETLWKLAHDPGQVGFDSLRGLAQWRALPAKQAEELIPLLRGHPLSQEPDRLLAVEWELRLHPDRREEILAGVLAEAKGADGTKLHTLGLWLNNLGEYKRTLEVLPEKVATTRQDLFLVYLDALAALNRWHDVERLLAIKDVPLGDIYLLAFRARIAEMEGRREEAELDWRRAHTVATGNAQQMIYLAQYAERMGRQDQAVLAYQSLATDVPTARFAYENLLRLAQRRGDAGDLLKLLAEMYKRWPSEPEVRNDYAYLSALLGRNLPEARAIAQGLVSALPAELPHRTALALAQLRLKDSKAAFAVYDGLNIPWEKIPARDRAVYTAVLGANGKIEEANKMAQTVELGGLFPEERALVQPWLKQS